MGYRLLARYTASSHLAVEGTLRSIELHTLDTGKWYIDWFPKFRQLNQLVLSVVLAVMSFGC